MPKIYSMIQKQTVMRKFPVMTVFLVIFMSSFVEMAKAQDIIITTKNDTIDCKIVNILSSHIHYEQKDNKRMTIGRYIPIEQVQEYHFGTRKRGNSSYVSPAKRNEEPFGRWKVGLQGGGAYLTASTADSRKNMKDMGIPQSQINDYHKQLKNGVYTGVETVIDIQCNLGNPTLYSSANQLDFGRTDITKTIEISNQGNGLLTWQIESLPAWLNILETICTQ